MRRFGETKKDMRESADMPVGRLKVDKRLENDERFLQRIKQARKGLKSGKGVKLEDI